MPERGSKTSTVAVVWASFGTFSARSKWFPIAIGDHGRNLIISLWPGDKATINVLTEYRLIPSQKIPSAKFRCKIPRLDFFWIKTASSSLIIFQTAKLSTQSISHLCWCNRRTFWRKNAGRGNITKGVLFLHGNVPAHWALVTQKNWPTWDSSVLIIHPILRIWSRRTTTCSLDWQNNWKVAIFRPTRRSLLPRRPGWTDKFLIFLSGLQKLEQRARKWIELRGEYVE